MKHVLRKVERGSYWIITYWDDVQDKVFYRRVKVVSNDKMNKLANKFGL